MKRPRKTCLGCPYLKRSQQPDLLGEPVCTFAGRETRLFWEDIIESDSVCGHGVSARARRPWTTGELKIAKKCRKNLGRHWEVEACKLLLRTPRAVASALWKAGVRKFAKNHYSPKDIAEIIAAVKEYYQAKRQLAALAIRHRRRFHVLVRLAQNAENRNLASSRGRQQRRRELDRLTRTFIGREI